MQNQPIAEDEIDLKELIKTLWNKRKFIVVFTLAVTLCSLGYVVITQPNPVYQGSVLVEIGETQSENFGSNPLDEVGNLAQVLSATLNINAELPKGINRTTEFPRIIELTKTGPQKQAIQRSLEEAVDYILARHQEKAAFYANVIPTKQIGDIRIGNTPINTPKKALIVSVALVSGLVISVFLIFFMQFIKEMRGALKEETL